MKGRLARKDGGPTKGVVDKDEAPSVVYAGKGSNVEKEAKERKAGGRLARKGGGPVHGSGTMNAGRSMRKAGGGLFSAAAKGMKPAGHKTEKDMG
jgi:hypothetical protein